MAGAPSVSAKGADEEGRDEVAGISEGGGAATVKVGATAKGERAERGPLASCGKLAGRERCLSLRKNAYCVYIAVRHQRPRHKCGLTLCNSQ